jgi:hypothetical protein
MWDADMFIQMELPVKSYQIQTLCLMYMAVEERWIPHLMIHICHGVCGLILGITTVTHLSHKARDTKELLLSNFLELKREKKELFHSRCVRVAAPMCERGGTDVWECWVV